MKLFTKIAVGVISSAMAIGVGVGLVTGGQLSANANADYGYTLATSNSNSYTCTVNGIDGIKMGTSSKTGNMTITVPSGTSSITFGAAAWNGVPTSIAFSGATVTPSEIELTADSGIKGNSPFTLTGDESSYHHTVALANINAETTITVTTTKQRAVVWYAAAEGLGDVEISIDQVHPEYEDGWYLEHIGSGIMSFTSTNDGIYADGYYTRWETTDEAIIFDNGGVSTYSSSNARMNIGYTADGGAIDDEFTITATVYNSSNEQVATSSHTFTFANSSEFLPVNHVTGIELDQTSINATLGDTPVTLHATIAPSYATNTNVTWTSSSEAVATVANGVVTFVGAGSTTITVTTEDGGFSASCAVQVTASEPAPITKTVAELLDICAGSSSNQTQAYIVTGTAMNVQTSAYGNFDLVDGNSTIKVYGSTTTESALSYSTTTGKYSFTNPQDFVASNVPAGSIVTMKVIAYLYNTTKEVSGIITNIESGSTGSEEPATLNKTVAELLDICSGGSSGQTQAYVVTGTVANVQTSNKGNFDLVDGESSIKVYGATLTTSALSWDGFAYVFTNPSNFDSTVVANGKIVTMKVIAYLYNTTKELSGVITNIQESAPVDVTGVTLDKTSASINMGETLQLTATVAPSNASNKNVTWSSDNAGVASVVNGVVTGVSAGTANITVTTANGGFTATCAVTVANASTLSSTVDLSSLADISGEVTDESITWVKGDVTVNNIKGSGTKVNNYYPGTPDKTYAQTRFYNGNQMTFSVPSGKVITKIEFAVDGSNYGGLNNTSAWSSGCSASAVSGMITVVVADQQIVTANPSGTGRGLSIKVTYKAGSAAGISVTGVTLNKETANLAIGGTLALTATVAPADATDKSVSWSSSSTSVATVSNEGVVTAVGAGTATITVTTTDGSFTATCTITVSDGPATYTGLVAEGTYYIKHANYYLKSNGTSSAPSAVEDRSEATQFTFTLVADNTYEIKSGSDYLYTTDTNNGIRVGSTEFTWIIEEGSLASGAYDIKGSSVNRFISLYNNADFRAYTSATASNRKQNTDLEAAGALTPEMEAIAWAQSFNSDLVCDATGAVAPSTTAWNTLSTSYASLSADAKAIIAGADLSSTTLNAEIKNAVRKYDYIMNKYGTSAYADFLARTGSTHSSVNNRVNDSTVYLVVGVVSVLMLSTVGAYFLLKKKKEN